MWLSGRALEDLKSEVCALPLAICDVSFSNQWMYLISMPVSQLEADWERYDAHTKGMGLETKALPQWVGISHETSATLPFQKWGFFKMKYLTHLSFPFLDPSKDCLYSREQRQQWKLQAQVGSSVPSLGTVVVNLSHNQVYIWCSLCLEAVNKL